MKKIYLAFVFVFLGALLSAQQSQPLRVEIEVDNTNSDDYHVIPVDSSGVLLFNSTDEKEKGLRKWVFTLYDTEFKEKSKNEISVNKKFGFIKYYFDTLSSNMYVLLIDDKDFDIVKFDIKSKSVTEVPGTLNQLISISHFVVSNDVVYWGGAKAISSSERNLRACGTMASCLVFPLFIPSYFFLLKHIPQTAVMCTDMKSGETVSKTFQFKGSARLVGIDIDRSDTMAYVLIENIPKKETHIVNLYKINETGKTISSSDFKMKSKNSLSSASLMQTSGGEKILIGTYSLLNNRVRVINSRAADVSSNGMCFVKFENNDAKYIKQYPFSKFENLYAYIGAFNKKYEAKLNKKKNKQKNEEKINYNLLLHKIIKNGDQYIVVAEAFYPEYERYCYTTYTNGRPSTTCKYRFIGYRYTHAIVAGIDNNGDLLWDQCFEIWNILTFNLKERVKSYMDTDGNLVLLYNYNGAIQSKVIKDGEVISEKEKTKIETNFDNDKVKENVESDAEFWYGNYFIAYGYQKIKNTETKDKRKVFYFNKIAYE